MFNETFKLSNGVEIPKLGLGTWMLNDEQAAQAVSDAVSIGYRHIDTAQAYMNEAGVGDVPFLRCRKRKTVHHDKDCSRIKDL